MSSRAHWPVCVSQLKHLFMYRSSSWPKQFAALWSFGGKQVQLTGCAVLTALILYQRLFWFFRHPEVYTAQVSVFLLLHKQLTYTPSFPHFSAAGTGTKWHNGRHQVSLLSPSMGLPTMTSGQPCACSVQYHAPIYSEQESCFPCITHWKLIL